jgi:hypothetical protein
MGYGENHKAYRIWSEEEQTILYSRDVKFLENVRGWEEPKVQAKKPEGDGIDYVIMLFPGEEQERVSASTLVPFTDDTSTILPNQDNTTESGTSSDVPGILSGADGPGVHDDESQEELLHVVSDSRNSREEDTGNDTSSQHWTHGRNLRERTAKVKPAKYTMTTGIVNDPPSIESLTREYGWNPDGDYW